MPDTTTHSRLHLLRNPRAAALAAVVLLAIGGGAGAVAMQATRPSVSMAPATPVAIRSLSDGGIVTIKGRVAEIFGNKFIMADASGRALVDTGREGETGRLVKAGAPVTVQGRFDRGFVRAAFIVGPDNQVVALGPLGGPHDDAGRHGPRHRPDDGLIAPVPGVGPADDAAPAAPASANSAGPQAAAAQAAPTAKQ